MSAARPSLPEYAHPPLVAATLGVFYDGTLELSPGALAEFQQQLGPEWIGDWSQVAAETINPARDSGLLTAGYQLKNVLGDRVVRVSPIHFAFTWLDADDGRYPRYENLRDGFVAAWDLWSELRGLEQQGLHKCAVSYLNRIPQGTVWQSAADWTFFQMLPLVSTGLASRVQFGHWLLQTPQLADGLAVNWMLDSPESESEPATIWVRLTSSAEVGNDSSSLLDGMDAGRAAIVKTFSDLMSPAANAYWGLRRRES